MTQESKDKIYIDIDDEITAIIDKLKKSHHKIVALVLPKRATMLQSIVNMRLLKKAAKTANKNVVLITSEEGLLPLAGAVGLHVADTLASKPKIPPIPHTPDKEVTVSAETEPDEGELDKTKSIGELAGKTDEDDVIEVDNTDLAEAGAAAEAIDSKAKRKPKFKIPNFEKFRVKFFLILAGGLVLITFLIWGLIFAPSAKIHVKTETTTILSDFGFTAKTDAAQNADLDNATLPAQTRSIAKSTEHKVTATGTKNIGNKAKGTMTVINCTDNSVNVPAGTTFTNNSFGFTSDSAVVVPGSNFKSNGECKKDGTASVAVIAANAGGSYNLSGGRTYTSSVGSTLTGTGSAMAGGTDQIVKVLSDKDINSAKEQVTENTVAVVDELKTELKKDGLVGIGETLVAKETKATSIPNVGEEATEATVTIETTYSLLGVFENDLAALIAKKAAEQIDNNQQKVQDHGISGAVFKVTNKVSDQEYKISLQAQPQIGPVINEQQLKEDIRGKKRGVAEGVVGGIPGVKEVRIEYSPFWVFSTPKAAKKITFVYE